MQTKNTLYLLLFLAMIGWGTSWVNTKILSDYVNPYEMVFLRFILTLVSMVPVIIYFKKSFKIGLKNTLLALGAAVFMILYMKYYFLGTKFGTASFGGALVTTLIPINTFIIMALFFKRKVRSKDVFALSLGAVGVMTMLEVWKLELSTVFSIENIYFLLAAILWPIMSVISARTKEISPLVFSFYIYLFTFLLDTLFFVDATSINFASLDTRFWFNMIFLAVVNTTFATSIYFLAIERLGASEATSFTFIVPFSAMSSGALFLQESIGVNVVFGCLLTLVAVYMINNLSFFQKKTSLKPKRSF